MRPIARLLTPILLASLVLTSCGGGDQKQPQQAPAQPASPPAAQTPPQQPQPAAPAGPVKGGTLNVASPQDPRGGLNPYKSPEGATEEIIANVMEGLLQVDTKGNLAPLLATEWELSPDGKVYTFSLKKGVKFHNGRDFTADDVKWTFDYILDKNNKHTRAADFATLEKVEVVDPATVRFTLKQPTAGLLANLASVQNGMQAKEAFDPDGKKVVGTGPFKLAEWVPNQFVKLARWENYHEAGKPYLDEVVFRVIPDAAATLAALKAGQVDVVPRLDLAQVDDVKKDTNLKLVTAPMNVVVISAFNTRKPPFDNLKVRQAVSMAVDRKAFIDFVMNGLGSPVGTFLSPTNPVYKDLTGMYKHDVAAAKKMLADAGHANGLSIKLRVPGNYFYGPRGAEVLKEQLAAVGIKAVIETMEWGRYLEDVYAKYNFDLTILGHTGRLDPEAMLNRFSKANYSGWESKELAAQLKAAAAEVDENKRKQMYQQMQELITSNAPAIFWADLHQFTGTRMDVSGWEIYPIYISLAKNIWKEKK